MSKRSPATPTGSFCRLIASMLIIDLVMQPVVAFAQPPSQIVVAPSNPGGVYTPTLDHTQSGIPQVNIAKPSAGGVSVNRFTQYGVGPEGLILNNATGTASTKTGGYILSNPNLGGSAARLILNEVTGTGTTSLNGFTEIGGNKAEFVLANPNGITCAGCGFINTSRVTLSTGVPTLQNGALTDLVVTGGAISFTGAGGNFLDVPVLDILARKVHFDAPVNGGGAITVVAGRNDINYATKAVTALPWDGSGPSIDIDSSALGGMYAGRISLIANARGAGVTAAGQMAANAGDLSITADGRLVLADQALASGKIAINAGSMANESTGVVAAGTGLSVSLAGDLSNDGALGSVSGGLSLGLAGTLTNKGSILANAGDISITGQAAGTSAAGISNQSVIQAAAGSISLTAAGLSNSAGATIAAFSTLQAAISGLTTNDGVLTASSGQFSGTFNGLSNSATGRIDAAQSLAIQASGLVTNQGTIYAGTDLSLALGTGLVNTGGKIVADSGSVTLGGVTAGTSTGSILNDGGRIQATTGSATIRSTSLVNNGAWGRGAISAGTDLLLGVSGNFTLDGEISSGRNTAYAVSGLLTIASGQTIGSSGNFTLRAQALTNNGIIQSGQLLSLVVEGDLTNRGLIYGATGIDLAVGGTLTNTATSYTNADGTTGYLGAAIIANAGSITIHGTTAGSSATAVVNRSSVIEASTGDMQIAAGSITNDVLGGVSVVRKFSILETVPHPGTYTQVHFTTSLPDKPGWRMLWAVDDEKTHTNPSLTIGVNADKLVAASAQPVISASRDLTLSVSGSITNDAGSITAGRDLTLTAGSLQNTGYSGKNTYTINCSSTGNHGVYCWTIGVIDPNGVSKGLPWSDQIIVIDRSQIGQNLPWYSVPGEVMLGSVSAGNNVTANVTTYINNATVADHVGTGAVGGYKGTVPDPGTPTHTSVSPGASPGLTNVSLPVVLTAIPGGSALFVPNPTPGARYLIESRPEFASLSGLYGSSYMLSRLGYDPNAAPPFLGDAYFDQRYVQKQVLDQTGKRYLDPSYVSDSAEMKALLDNGVAAAGSLQLQLGVALTEAQVASLDRNLVWYVKTEVNGQEVLAPKLYLAPSLTLNPGINGALIAGREVTVQTSALVNSGLVASADELSVVTLGDLANLGGTLSSDGNQTLTAGGSVLNESQSHSWTEATGFNAGMRGTGSSSGIDATAQITSGGSLSITANKSVAGTASVISSGGDLKIAAGQDVTMGTLDLTQVSDWGSGGERYHFDSTTVVGSQIRAGGAASVSAGSDLVLSASSLSAAGTAGLTAGRDLALLAEANQQTYTWDRRSGGGFFSDKSSDIGTRSVTSYKGASVTSSGGDVALSSGRNTTLNAAELKANKHLSVTLAPDGTLTLGAVKDSDYLDRKTASSNFAWQSQEQQGHFIETVRQTLLTAGEGFTITAPGGIKVEYHDTGNVRDSIRQLSQIPGLEYLKDLENRPGVDWQGIQAAYQTWDYKSEGLSGPMSALIMIAVAIATQGAGAELLGLTAAADGAIAVGAANAALTTLIGTATVSLINNKGNLGKVLSAVASTDFVRQLAISLLTMDVSNGVAGGTISSASSSFLEKAIAAAQQQLLRAAVNIAVQATIGGQKLSDALKSSLTAALAMGFGQLANGAVGDAIKSQDWTPGGPESVLLHGMVGFVQGQLANGNGLAGAFGAGAAEVLTPMISDFLADHGIAPGTAQYARLMQAGAQSIGTIIGGLTAGDGGGVAGGQTAASSVVYNFLLHGSQIDAIKGKAKELAGNAQFNKTCDESCWNSRLLGQTLLQSDSSFAYLPYDVEAASILAEMQRNSSVIFDYRGTSLYDQHIDDPAAQDPANLANWKFAQAYRAAGIAILTSQPGPIVCVDAYECQQAESLRIGLENEAVGWSIAKLIGTVVAGGSSLIKASSYGFGDSTPGLRVSNGVELNPALPDPVAGLAYAAKTLDSTNPNIANSQVNGYVAELRLANAVAEIPGETVIRYGDRIGANGADVISVTSDGTVRLWDSKFLSANRPVPPTSTFTPGSNTLASAIKQAEDAIRASNLPVDVLARARQNITEGNVSIITAGSGNARNSVVLKLCGWKLCQ